jgi:hypothetical protein
MNNLVVNYLSENKNNFPKKDLIIELEKAGYTTSEIEDGIREVFKEETVSTSKKVYTVDYIIKKWFPVIGILFIVGGLSYLFYDGLWKNVNEIGRLAIGFIAGILFITGGYTFEDKLRGFGDVVIGGGVLMMYVTLIFGSRFQSAETAIIPEVFALMIALTFSVAIAFYAYTRQSKYILILGAIGGYLTPFFVGKAGEFKNYLISDTPFQYELGLPVFLIYFTAIGIAVFLVSNKMFLKGVGLLNSAGLFLGTFSLIAFMGDKFYENVMLLAIFSVVVVALHIAAMVINAKRFEKETDPFLIGGYILPFIWFVAMVVSFLDNSLSDFGSASLFIVISAVYFVGWYYLRSVTNSDRHFALYVGGLASLIFGIIYIIPTLDEYQGIFLSAISLLFMILYKYKSLVSREAAMLMFAVGGVLFNFFVLNKVSFEGIGELSGKSIFSIITLIPLVLMSPMARLLPSKSELFDIRKVLGYFATALIIIILLVDIFDWQKIPLDFLFMTLPALVLAILGSVEKVDISKKKFFDGAIAVATVGFIETFFIMLDKISTASSSNHFMSTEESLVGVTTLITLFLVIRGYKRLAEKGIAKKTPFIVTFIFYLTLWSVVTYEIVGLFNSVGLDYSNKAIEGIRAFAITIWWAGLALWMLFTAGLKNKFRDQKNIGFALLAMTILKVVFYDLANVNTNLKVFLFIIIGSAITAVSYYANKNDDEKLR